ncbi:MAG: immunity 53 family protein [Planctomycetes bacterium]|nr:immunity 53 family protein [Planctomycetota bacterium]MBI3848329.1 immunity 53 family protein [Planctomycetota bacterium]
MSRAADFLEALQNWYLAQCDGSWEHTWGVAIETLDNPGWPVRIDLEETGLDSTTFTRVAVDRSEHDWYQCWVEDHVFNGAGGPTNMKDILEVFLAWVDAGTTPPH